MSEQPTTSAGWEEWHHKQHAGLPQPEPSIPQSFLPGLGTIRRCVFCGCLVAGGPTLCDRCAASEPVKAPPEQGPAPDMVNHPPHYTFGCLEVIDVIEDWKLCFNLGNAVKYIARAAHKGHELEDLKKARWYLERRISQLESTSPASDCKPCPSNWHERPAPGLDRCPDCGERRDPDPEL